MSGIRTTLKARAAAGLVTRRSAGCHYWYLARHAARRIHATRRYQSRAKVFLSQTPPRG
jgi:hypothetical protein